MGLRFNLQIANWLAHVLDERMPIPKLGSDWEEQEALRMFLQSLGDRDRFYSTSWGRQRYDDVVQGARESIGHEPISRILADLRRFLGGRPWTAMLVPSGADPESDRLMCSKDFLRELIHIRPEDPGLVLQMETAQEPVFSLTDVFPAFRTALASSTEWPGVLLWTGGGGSVFLPFDKARLVEQGQWIFSHLGTTVGVDLALLKEQYLSEFRSTISQSGNHLTIVHVSDIHLGCRDASLRLPRVQDLLRNLIGDLDHEGHVVVPLISGDLMDSPDEDNLDRVRAFLGTFAGLAIPPVVLLGNHDVRKDGFLSETLRMAMQIESYSPSVKLFEDFRLGIACFDSVRGGNLARGYIGERQFLDMGSKLDNKCRDYVVLAALHHHPIPVRVPDWYARPFYERILGSAFEKTDDLKDASDFVDFVEGRQFAAILHGHKHIPRMDATPKGIPVIGCGSTVGKVVTSDRRPFMSINLITFNRANGRIAARLLAERIPGGGLREFRSHEIVCGPQPARTYQSIF